MTPPLSPLTVHDLWALEREGVVGVRLRLHLVHLGQDAVVEVAVGLKVEL